MRLVIAFVAVTLPAVLVCTGCGGEILTYADPDYGFSFDYDDSWELQEVPVGGLPAGASKSVGVFDPHGSDDGNNLTFDYFSVSVYDLGAATTPTADELTAGFADYLRRLEDSDDTFWVIEEPSPAEVNGRPAVSIAYMYSANDQEIRCTEYRLVDIGGMVYSFYTQSAVTYWERNSEVFGIFLDSFTLEEDL